MNGREGLTYVYAVAADTPALRASLDGVQGISGAPVFLLGGHRPDVDTGAEQGSGPDAVAFVSSRVPADEFDEPNLKERFEDLEWLEGVARSHHEVVQAVGRHGTVLPLRMATVYQNDERARQALAAQRHAFAERLSLLRGRSEFGVKLYVSPAAPPENGVNSADSPDTSSLSPGKAYLRSRRAQHHARESRYEPAERAAARVEELASRFSTHRVRHPAQRGALAGPEENVLNDAYLVPADRADEFRSALTGAMEGVDGVRMEVTGPWAPYSFAMPPPASEPTASEPATSEPTASEPPASEPATSEPPAPQRSVQRDGRTP
ncbi:MULTISPECIES: GvpL/GvpF family gas vesicle protein [unclassified Streptomyces]|uniref:GvpL/GvpF family gas vesicle protein n=1 Tax=Streptomyces sp. NPDC127129 TaxID=3345373 RepID=UPI00363DD8B4